MNVAVIIAAAGKSERFGPSRKLDQDVGGRPLLLRTVELFTKVDEVRSIIVAAPPDDFDDFKSKYGPSLGFHGASVVAGGREARWETVRNALAEVPADCTHVAAQVKRAVEASQRGERPAWLEFSAEKLKGRIVSIPERREIPTEIDEQLIVELYSK